MAKPSLHDPIPGLPHRHVAIPPAPGESDARRAVCATTGGDSGPVESGDEPVGSRWLIRRFRTGPQSESHGTFPPPALRTRRADFRHRALQSGSHTGFPVATSRRVLRAVAPGSHPACVVRPVDALTTATARVVPFAYACDDVWHSCSFIGVIGRSATPGACSRSPSLPPAPLPSARHCPASTVVRASPPWPARPCPHASVGACYATGRASRSVHSPLPHVRRHNRSVPVAASRPLAAFPDIQAGRLPIARFEACSAFTRVATAQVCRRSASADVVTSRPLRRYRPTVAGRTGAFHGANVYSRQSTRSLRRRRLRSENSISPWISSRI